MVKYILIRTTETGLKASQIYIEIGVNVLGGLWRLDEKNVEKEYNNKTVVVQWESKEFSLESTRLTGSPSNE